MKYKLLFILIITFLLLPLGDVYACTSFAVYSKQVYYGMNFDFANFPMKFLISASGDIRTFHLAFERNFGEVKFFVNTAGMNNKGLFASCQEMHPENENLREKTDTDMFIFELYEAINSCSSTEAIEKNRNNRTLIDMPGITLHNFFADTTGRAIVTEAADNKTHITENDENYMVMTNFQNYTMAGKKYNEANGKGDDRYIICHEFLRQHASDFSIEKGLELLEMSYNRDPEYPTSCSMIFDPQKQEVYIALERDFSKILKLSIEKRTIKTFKGYTTDTSLPIPLGDEGLLVEDLQATFL